MGVYCIDCYLQIAVDGDLLSILVYSKRIIEVALRFDSTGRSDVRRLKGNTSPANTLGDVMIIFDG
jgi:hypothetical protein